MPNDKEVAQVTSSFSGRTYVNVRLQQKLIVIIKYFADYSLDLSFLSVSMLGIVRRK